MKVINAEGGRFIGMTKIHGREEGISRKRKREDPYHFLNNVGYYFQQGMISKTIIEKFRKIVLNWTNKSEGGKEKANKDWKSYFLPEYLHRATDNNGKKVEEWRTKFHGSDIKIISVCPELKNIVSIIKETLKWENGVIESLGYLRSPKKFQAGEVHADLAELTAEHTVTVLIGLSTNAAPTGLANNVTAPAATAPTAAET